MCAFVSQDEKHHQNSLVSPSNCFFSGDKEALRRDSNKGLSSNLNGFSPFSRWILPFYDFSWLWRVWLLVFGTSLPVTVYSGEALMLDSSLQVSLRFHIVFFYFVASRSFLEHFGSCYSGVCAWWCVLHSGEFCLL